MNTLVQRKETRHSPASMSSKNKRKENGRESMSRNYYILGVNGEWNMKPNSMLTINELKKELKMVITPSHILLANLT